MNKKLRDELFDTIYNTAQAKGALAAAACVPVPMVVEERVNMADDNSPVKQSWFVADGVCGFAWVVVRPGTSSFARWLVKNDYAGPRYYGGVSIWIGGYNQCHQKKAAHAHAMAEYLRGVGIKASAGDRLD